MRLNIGKLCAEKFLSTLDSDLLNDINILTAALVTLAGITLSLLICEN